MDFDSSNQIDAESTAQPLSQQHKARLGIDHEPFRQDAAMPMPWLDGVDPVGIPFPVSDSVQQACKGMEHLGTASCGEHYAALKQLEQEPRDSLWARSMVERITSLVASQTAYSIRAIDCRTTVCAVEIESIRGVFDREAAEYLNNELSRVDRIYGYEMNSSNERVTVTSMTFRKR